ncbi:hypothetical protein OEW28_11190 [Defluviimonas sp. WL0002]|uniref:Uncharacterized protein n=1 Tax=Albidovulum marisflavi TaxID=2984159 RepID=A0ABT2ZDJ1_9RHOB|nr:hypothetical protein [Defluviimonas sp. WL0002]MCV2869192.1 hypothetical protein [Defluviimonas sp. WL0002]
MSERFSDLKKIPREPAARMLAMANAKLQTKLSLPASAPVQKVLETLEAEGATVDIIRLLSVALPARERVWWACLAARDYIGEAPENNTPSLAAAEAWVFKPTAENCERARATLDTAEVDDDTVYLANAVVFADGTLGPGELSHHQGPVGASEVSAFAMNIVAMGKHSDKFEQYTQMVIDRAVDIARGGNGRIEPGKQKAKEG